MSGKYQRSNKLKRKADKASRKASMRAQYASWRDAGENSKRAQRRESFRILRPFRQRQRSKVMSPIPGMTMSQHRNQISLKGYLRWLKSNG